MAGSAWRDSRGRGTLAGGERIPEGLRWRCVLEVLRAAVMPRERLGLAVGGGGGSDDAGGYVGVGCAILHHTPTHHALTSSSTVHAQSSAVNHDYLLLFLLFLSFRRVFLLL